MTKTPYTVYILLCGDRSFYTGMTNDLEKRFALHRAGKASRYTRARNVRAIVYTEVCATKGDALRREIAIKRLTRKEKLELIARSHEK